MLEPESIEIEEVIGKLPLDYGDRIYYIALRELRSPASADDVRSETMLRVIRALRDGALRNQAALPGFVLGIARNVIREQLRSANRFDGMESAGQPESPAPTVDSAERQALAMALERLDPREREISRYAFYDDLSRDEISARMGIMPDRVRLVKSRALKSFREFYLRFTEARRK